jgi:hypothetical protein
MDANKAGLLEEVFNHLVLPPKLPGKPFENPVSLLHELGRRLQKACVTLRPLVPAKIWNPLIASLNIIIKIFSPERICSKLFISSLRAITIIGWCFMFLSRMLPFLFTKTSGAYAVRC